MNLGRLSMVLIEGDNYNLYHKRREIAKEKGKINLFISFCNDLSFSFHFYNSTSKSKISNSTSLKPFLRLPSCSFQFVNNTSKCSLTQILFNSFIELTCMFLFLKFLYLYHNHLACIYFVCRIPVAGKIVQQIFVMDRL